MIYEDTGILKFNSQLYLTFLKNSKKFKNNHIINEDKNLLIDIPEELINFCIENKNTLISFSDVKKLMKNSKHYSNIKNLQLNDTLFFSIFDFNDDNEINEFHMKLFKHLNSDEIDLANSDFKQYCSLLDSFCNVEDFKPINVCVINTYANDIYSTIYHELSHIIQKICNIRITPTTKFNQHVEKTKITANKKFKKLISLNISYEDLCYYFNSTEYTTHVDELITGLWNTYLKFYKNQFLNILFFLITVRKEIKNNSDFNKSTLLQHYAEANNNNIAPLIMFIAAYYFNHKYQKINDKIQNSLIKKFNVYFKKK